MRKPMERERVVSLRGKLNVADVTEADYELAVAVQAEVLKAQGIERRVLAGIRNRLRAGGKDLGVRHYFDFELGIVRRRAKTGTE